MLIAATRYALTKERWWVIPNLVGLQVGLYYDVLRYIVPDAEILAQVVFNLFIAWTLITFTTVLAVLIVNATWLLGISGRGSRLARKWGLGLWLLFCCLWLVLLCFTPGAIRLIALWIAIAGGHF
jgi:hypothetical protein